MDLIRIRPVGTAISTRLPRCGPAHFEIAGSLRTGLHGLLPSLLLGLFPAGPSITLLDHSIWPCWAAEICSILGLFNWTSLSGLEMALFLSLLMDLIRIGPVGTAISTRLPRCGPAHFEIAGSLRTGLHGLLPSLLLGLFSAGPSITLLDHSTWPCWAAEICSILGLVNWTSLSGLEMALEGKLDELRTKSAYDDLRIITPEVLLYARGKIVSRDGFGRALCVKIIGASNGKSWVHIFEGTLSTLFWTVESEISFGIVSPGLGPLWFLPGRDGGDGTKCTHATTKKSDERVDTIMGGWGGYFGDNKAREWMWQLMLLPVLVVDYFFGWIKVLCLHGRCDMQLICYNGNKGGGWFEGMRLEKGNEVPPRQLDTSFMEHVNKEKPFELKFFEPPDPGDSKPVEEEMKDVGAETPCEGKDGNDPRLSPRLTRLVEEQGINRYRLRSGHESGKGPLRHHAAKAKLMKPDRRRRNKQSYSFDKENRSINMTVQPEENNLSGHVVGEANNAGQSIEEANMQSNLHGDVSGSDDTTISPACCNMDRDEMQLGGPSLAGMLTTDKVTMNMEYAGDSILNNIFIQSSCDDVLIEGEEQEVSSDQSTKHRSFTDMTSDKVSNCNMLEITNIVGFFPGITHVSKQGNQKLA
ncbi:hypothetical protein L1987_32367 [Smallanthus sonchifolius]|uniref:Uncharacterized protein n=1 Tax=Smallanthus sonchifolius TaxID=185202 RepID=A0ACB9I929_9ASTR|nr:hypothetical protein L1987_32367 [Smallanthus sonchifolius]